MAEITLYHLPGACSRVTLTALEQCGLTYRDEIVDLAKGAQHSPQYRAVNPRGKIPALVVDGRLLSENLAILCWLDGQCPDAGLLPRAHGNQWSRAQVLSDLAWLSSVWHPAVRANRMPVRWTTGDVDPVRQRGKELVAPLFAALEERLATQDWWYGDAWSILDTYAYWNYTTAEEGEFDLSPYPRIAAHRARVEAWPAFRRAMAREEEALERGE